MNIKIFCIVVFLGNGIVSSQVLRTVWNDLQLPRSLQEKDMRPKYLESNQFGDLYLLDDENYWLVVIPGDGTDPRIAGGWGDQGELFSSPSDISVSGGLDVLVCDNATHRILRFDRKLNFIADVYLTDISDENLEYPFRIAQNEFGEIMIAAWGTWEISVLSKQGRFINTIGDATYGEDRFSRIEDMKVGPNNELAIVDGGKSLFMLVAREGRVMRKVPLPAGDVAVLHPWRDRWLIMTTDGALYVLSQDANSFNGVHAERSIEREVAVSDCTVLGDVLYAADAVRGTILTTELKFIE